MPHDDDRVSRLDMEIGNGGYGMIRLDPDPINAAVRGADRVVNLANRMSKPILLASIAYNTVQIGMSVADDLKKDTSRNTVTTVAKVAGGFGGGAGGSMAGAALGTAICPGLGTVIGGMIGGMAGGYGASAGTGAVVDVIADDCDYDIDVVICIKCEKKFKRRTYRTGNVRVCPDCEK